MGMCFVGLLGIYGVGFLNLNKILMMSLLLK